MKRIQLGEFEEVVLLTVGSCTAMPPEYHTEIEGDLLESYERRRAEAGRTSANLQLFRDVLLLFRPGIIQSAATHQPLTNNGTIWR